TVPCTTKAAAWPQASRRWRKARARWLPPSTPRHGGSWLSEHRSDESLKSKKTSSIAIEKARVQNGTPDDVDRCGVDRGAMVRPADVDGADCVDGDRHSADDRRGDHCRGHFTLPEDECRPGVCLYRDGRLARDHGWRRDRAARRSPRGRGEPED